jgi:hypothetical protein
MFGGSLSAPHDRGRRTEDGLSDMPTPGISRRFRLRIGADSALAPSGPFRQAAAVCKASQRAASVAAVATLRQAARGTIP